MSDGIKCPIDDVNILRYANTNAVEMYLAKRIHQHNGPNFGDIERTLECIREHLATAPVWLVFVGTVGEKCMLQITLACRRPALIVGLDKRILYITDQRVLLPIYDVTILFSGTAREIVMQLRSYMQLMEGS